MSSSTAKPARCASAATPARSRARCTTAPPPPGRADVHFDHGGFFHELDLRAGHWATDHPCRDDLYRGSYEVLDARRWRQEWAVRGPAKDHLIVTRFTRASG